LGLKIDDEIAHAQNAAARRLGKLRNSKGRMSRADAIEQVAPHHELDVGTLTNWSDGKTGARQAIRGRVGISLKVDFRFGALRTNIAPSGQAPMPRGGASKTRGLTAGPMIEVAVMPLVIARFLEGARRVAPSLVARSTSPQRPLDQRLSPTSE
jgi:hypothetical protein